MSTYESNYSKLTAKKNRTRLYSFEEMSNIKNLIKNYYTTFFPEIRLNTNEANFLSLSEEVNQVVFEGKRIIKPKYLCELYNNPSTTTRRHIKLIDGIVNYINQTIEQKKNIDIKFDPYAVENFVFDEHAKIFRKIGIRQVDYNIQKGYTVKTCVTKVLNSLSFMGVGGKKWVEEEGAINDMIKRLLLRRQTNQIRFLLLNPHSDDALDFNKGRNFSHETFVKDLNKSINFFKLLKEKSGIDIQLRLYTGMPNFRITIIDQRIAILGTYSTISHNGLDSPQIVFKTVSTWSFAYNLIAYFEEVWKKSIIKI